MALDIESISLEEQRKAAFSKVLRCVSACEQSSLKMRKKLLAAGFSEEAANSAIQKAQNCGAIDDVRYSNCLVRAAAASGKGMEFVKREIASLGISVEDLEAYEEYMEAGEEAQIETACDLLRRHPPRAKDKRGAAFKKLVSKGYSFHIASQAVSLWLSE